MTVTTRVLIVVATGVAVFGACYYSIDLMGFTAGSVKYCLVLGVGVGILGSVWRLTAPKDRPSSHPD